VDLDSKLELIDLIVFPFDAVFEKVPNQNNTYLLRFESNEDKYFFYLQVSHIKCRKRSPLRSS
jgi:hypothetical protein